MKKCYSILFHLFMTVSLCASLASCGSDDNTLTEAKTDGSGSGDTATGTLQVAVYPVTDTEGIVPRLNMAAEDFTITELYDTEHPEVIMYHFMEPATGSSVMFLADSEGCWMYNLDPYADRQTGSNVCSILIDGSDYVVSEGSVDWTTGKYTPISIQRIARDNASEAKGTAAHAASLTRYDDGMDFARELVQKNIIDPLAKIFSAGNTISEKMPGFNLYFKAMDKVAIPMLEMHLYSNDPKKLADLGSRQINGMVVEAAKVSKATSMWNLYKRSIVGRSHNLTMAEAEVADSEYDTPTLTNRTFTFAKNTEMLPSNNFEVLDMSGLYSLSVWLYDVGKTTASVKGSFTDHSHTAGYVASMGYVIRGDGREWTEYSNFNGPFTINGLTPGATYSVSSYATVMGIRYESKPVVFTTIGEFELSTYELTFYGAGGSNTVDVKLPTDKWTWQVASAPAWCNTRVNGTQLTVSVAAYSEERSGDIVVNAKGPDGSTLSKTISVRQKVRGDFILFKGKYTLVMEDKYPGSSTIDRTETEAEMVITLMKMGGKWNITASLPLAGLHLINWTIGSTPPALSAEGRNLTMFNSHDGGSIITIDGDTRDTDGKGNGSFTIKIDLNNGTAKILDTYKWSGNDYRDNYHTVTESINATLYETSIEE